MEVPRNEPLLPLKQPPWPATVEYLAFAKLPMAKPKPLITNLLDCGSRILFGGGSKTFKTWLQCDLAVSLAAGAPWLGFDTHRVRVLYLNLELREYYMQRRLAEIRRVRDISLAESTFFVWNLRGLAFSRDQLVTELLRRCDDLGINIVFIDPFYRLLSQLEDENSQTHMGAVLRSFDEVNKRDITSAFGIHFSKGNQASKEPEDRISGAGTIVRDADDVITLTKHEENLAFTLDFIIRDHPPIDSFVVRWEAPIMKRTDLDPSKIKKARGRHVSFDPDDLLELIRENDDQFGSKELQEKAAEDLGWKERTFYEKLGFLNKHKRVFKSKITGKWGVKVQK
jgi:AAA domain